MTQKTTPSESELSPEVLAQVQKVRLSLAETVEALKGLQSKGLTKAGIRSVLENGLSPSDSLRNELADLSEMVPDEEIVTAIAGMGPALVSHLDEVRKAIRKLCEKPCERPGERHSAKNHAHKEDIVSAVEDHDLCAEDVTKAIITLLSANLIYRPLRSDEVYAWV